MVPQFHSRLPTAFRLGGGKNTFFDAIGGQPAYRGTGSRTRDILVHPCATANDSDGRGNSPLYTSRRIDRPLEELSLEMKYEAGEQSRPVLKFGGPTEFVTHAIVPKLPLDVAQFTVVFDLTVPLLCNAYLQMNSTSSSQRSESMKPGVQYVPIADERFHLIAPIDYDAPETDLKEWMDRQRWISYGLELPIIRRYYQTQFGERPGIRPEMILPNVDAILKAIEAGHGISVLPDYLVEVAVSAGRVQRIALERFATNQLYVAYRTESRHDPVLRQVVETLR
nr:substrate-binding domain-containing protein [Exiguobacterium sp. SL14]